MTKKLTSPVDETSSLLNNLQSYNDDSNYNTYHRGSASVVQTILNESNTCMGTGCLALPYAARLGGVVLHTIGMFAIALWNVYSVHRLCQCLQLLPKGAVLYEDDENSQTIPAAEGLTKQPTDPGIEVASSSSQSEPPCHKRPSTLQQLQQRASKTSTVPPPPPEGTSTYSRVAWYAFGPVGLLALDVLMAILFIGVVVTFVNAIRSFLRDTPVSTGSDLIDAIAIAFVIGPISAVPDMSYLSRVSGAGMFALFLSFGVIAVYGIIVMNNDDHHHLDESNVLKTTASSDALNWGPEGMEGVSTWFGATVFGFGVAPLAYNFRESMAEPTHLVRASTVALLIVAITYVVLGVGVYSLFRTVDGDILHMLPSEGWLPLFTRLSMAVVVTLTAPLLIVPCGQLVEGKILKTSAISGAEIPYSIRATVRIGIALLCVCISVLVPGFVSVLSLVGCASVATVGFVVPPLLYLRLRLMRSSRWSWDLAFDVVMLLWGTAATAISTSYTFQGVMASKV